MSCEVHLNDIGTIFKLQIYDSSDTILDISSATDTYIKFKKPDGQTIIKTASFVTDGSDGLIQYIAESGVINQLGTWKIQGVVYVNQKVWNSSVKSFKVNRNL